MSIHKLSRVLNSSMEKLVRRLSPRVEARSKSSGMERSFSVILSLKMLPEKPANLKGRPKIVMVLQWIIAPIISVVYSSFCAFYAQGRLAFGKYMEKFDVTRKVVKQHDDPPKDS